MNEEAEMAIHSPMDTRVHSSRARKSRGAAVKWLLTAVVLALALLMISPLFWMLSTSFKTRAEVFVYPIHWIPSHIVVDNYIRVWSGAGSFFKYYANSLKVSVFSTSGAVFLSAFAAYGFSRIAFKGRDALFLVYLSMMMVPPQVLFVPKFMMFNWIGIYNTLWALILPGMFTIFGVFLLRQFFMSIPEEITEAAFIDGAGHFRIFFRMMLALSRPALTTLFIIDFSWNWNNYEDALVFLLDQDLYTVPLGLQNFILEHTIDYNGMMAASTVTILPIVLLYFIGQKFIIQGIAHTAVKG